MALKQHGGDLIAQLFTRQFALGIVGVLCHLIGIHQQVIFDWVGWERAGIG